MPFVPYDCDRSSSSSPERKETPEPFDTWPVDPLKDSDIKEC